MHNDLPDTYTIREQQKRIDRLERLCKELHAVLYSAPLQMNERYQHWYERYDAMEAAYYALFGKEQK